MDAGGFREEFREFVISIFRKEFLDFKEELRDEFLSLLDNSNFRIENLENDLKILNKRLEELNRTAGEIIDKIEDVNENFSTKVSDVREEFFAKMEEFREKVYSLNDDLNMRIDEALYKSDSIKEELLSRIDFVRDEFSGYVNSVLEETKSNLDQINKEVRKISTGFDEISRSFEYNMKKMNELEEEFKKIKARQELIHDLVRRVKAIESRIYK